MMQDGKAVAAKAGGIPATNENKEEKKSATPRSEISSFHQKCLAWMNECEAYQMDSIRIVTTAVNYGRTAAELAPDELWYINQFLNLGLYKDDANNMSKVATHRLQRAYKLIKTTVPFLLAKQQLDATMIVMDVNANETGLKRSLDFLRPRPNTNKTDTSQ